MRNKNINKTDQKKYNPHHGVVGNDESSYLSFFKNLIFEREQDRMHEYSMMIDRYHFISQKKKVIAPFSVSEIGIAIIFFLADFFFFFFFFFFLKISEKREVQKK